MEEEAFLDSTTWLTCSSMAKLTADLNHLGTKTRLGSLRHAVDFDRGSKAEWAAGREHLQLGIGLGDGGNSDVLAHRRKS